MQDFDVAQSQKSRRSRFSPCQNAGTQKDPTPALATTRQEHSQLRAVPEKGEIAAAMKPRGAIRRPASRPSNNPSRIRCCARLGPFSTLLEVNANLRRTSTRERLPLKVATHGQKSTWGESARQLRVPACVAAGRTAADHGPQVGSDATKIACAIGAMSSEFGGMPGQAAKKRGLNRLAPAILNGQDSLRHGYLTVRRSMIFSINWRGNFIRQIDVIITRREDRAQLRFGIIAAVPFARCEARDSRVSLAISPPIIGPARTYPKREPATVPRRILNPNRYPLPHLCRRNGYSWTP